MSPLPTVGGSDLPSVELPGDGVEPLRYDALAAERAGVLEDDSAVVRSKYSPKGIISSPDKTVGTIPFDWLHLSQSSSESDRCTHSLF
jgi:hypothetical protein